jgi:oligoribonuclease NrnB/cAMP/cGMP phosphodiesterase (DHH superfamily)
METQLNKTMSNRELIWIDSDLDGVCSYLTFKWLVKKLPYKCTTIKKFRADFQKWLLTNKIEDYDQIYILDIDVSNSTDLVDKPNITIIDHHQTHVDIAHVYEHANTILETFPSCTKLVLKTYKNNIGKLSAEQLKLISYADDYDCYALKYKESIDLNTIFWNYTSNRFDKFINEFDEGFVKFNDFHKNIINIHKKKLQEVLDTAEVYAGSIKIGDKTYKIVSAHCNYALNEIADALITKYNADISIIVNMPGNYVSYRKAKGCEIQLHKFAEKISDGGGHATAAGGKITDTFMTFCKALKKL